MQSGQSLLSASNMYKLEWSHSLEERAQRISLSCRNNNSNNNNFDTSAINADIGQNVYVDQGFTGVRDFHKRGAILESAIHTWWAEVVTYGLPQLCVPGQEIQCYQNIHNFVNMAYFRATQMGCAINHNCGQQTLFVCLYNKGLSKLAQCFIL